MRDSSFMDPPLVAQGKVAAIQAGEAIRSWWKLEQSRNELSRCQLIVTSPLSRCIQTTLLAFGLPGDFYTDDTCLPMVSVEAVREAYGTNYPDKRRCKSVLQQHFFMIQFDPAMTEDDTCWLPETRETWDHVRERVHEFLAWIVERQEATMIVVSHGVWMEACLQGTGALRDGQRVHNCDAFLCHVVSNGGQFLRLENGTQIHGQT
jgi:broad specificity phosphatase PhoE